jgi:outer membrane protein assembly factor BamD
MRRVSVISIVILGLFVAFSCSKFRRIEKNPDWRVKYEAGLAYYAKKDYYRSSILFEQILPIVRGLPEAEKVQFYLAYCQYYEKLYLLSAEQFKSFYETYGRGSLSEEARYMHAYSLYKSSPGPSLDQSESIQAMTLMQDFLNRFQNSKFKEQATEVIYTVQNRLEVKGFDNAKQYVRMRSYKAAIISLDNFQKNFPDSKFLEESYFLIVQSQFLLAEESVLSKQRERYLDVIENYKSFVDRYPSSKFLKDAERYYMTSNSKLLTLKATTNS